MLIRRSAKMLAENVDCAWRVSKKEFGSQKNSSLRVQRQQLPTESQVLEDEVFPGTENADQATEEMSERHDHSRNYIGKVRIELCAKSFILQVYDVSARHNPERSSGQRISQSQGGPGA
jgi:hypothetical protein